MILQPEHEHEQTPPEVQKPKTPVKAAKVVPTPLPSPPPPASPIEKESQLSSLQSPPILLKMLQNSNTLVPQNATSQIRQKMKYMQQKVHFSFSQGPNQYLKHLRAKRKPQTEQMVKQMIQIENWLAVNKVWSGKTKLYERGEISSLKGQISGKIQEMKSGMMSLSMLDKKANSYIQNLLEFKKNNYWNVDNENKKRTRLFLSKMKRIQSEQHKRYEKQLVRQEYKIQVSMQKDKQREEQTRKKVHSKELEKQLLWRKEREKVSEEDRKKREEIEQKLQKYHTEKPVHVRLQERFIKKILQPMQEQRQRKLQQIRKAHQPIEQEQIEQHSQRYQEYKESLLQQHRKKDEQFHQYNGQLQNNLKELYHSRFHKGIEPRFYNSVKVGQSQAKKKVRDYSVSVFENHKPKIDQNKRSMVRQTIKDLELRQDKTKVKIRQEDGSFVVQEKPEFNAYRLGVQYLEKLREDNQGKPRKDRSASLMDIPLQPRVKRIDYLRQNRPKALLQKKTIGEWKKVVGDISYSPRQKYEFIMEQAAVMQEKSAMKQAQMRSYGKGDRALDLKSEMDMYYAQSVAAKMVVLKDVIMKE